MQIVGEAVHSGRVLNDPVEEICQGWDVASRRPVCADGCGADPAVRIQAQKCHKQHSHWRQRRTERKREREIETRVEQQRVRENLSSSEKNRRVHPQMEKEI